MPVYQVSGVTGRPRPPGWTYEGSLPLAEFEQHLAASPWQPVATRPPRRPGDGWLVDFTLHVDGEAIVGHLGTQYHRLVLDGSIEAVARVAVWYRGLINPDDHLVIGAIGDRVVGWIELTLQTDVAELTQRLRALPPATVAPDPRRQRVIRRRQARLAARLERAGVPAASLQLLAATDQDVVFGLTVAWSEALARWRQVRALVDELGYWPVLLDEAATAASVIDDFAERGNWAVAAILAAAETIEPSAFYASWRPYDDAELGRSADQLPAWPDEGGARPARRSYFAGPDPLAGGRAVPPPVVLALVPARAGWMVPAILRWGGGHGCPNPAEQVAVLRDWQRRYGADVVALFPYGIELHAARVAATRAEALALAHEQLVYCSDIEDVRSLEDLAKILMVSQIWSFRWE